MEKGKVRRNPAVTRYAREKLEKDLTIRFLVGKIHNIRWRLERMTILAAPTHRLNEMYALLSDVNNLCDQLSMKYPHRNLQFYGRRGTPRRK